MQNGCPARSAGGAPIVMVYETTRTLPLWQRSAPSACSGRASVSPRRNRVPMRVDAAKEHFEKYLSERRLSVEQVDAENALVAMAGFYLDVRADKVDMEQGGDMLLFDWGTYEWDDGPRFQYCVSRQFILDGEVPQCWHLALTLYYDSDSRTLTLDAGQRACPSFADLDSFMAFVDGAPATRYARRRHPSGIRLDLEEVEYEDSEQLEEAPAESAIVDLR